MFRSYKCIPTLTSLFFTILLLIFVFVVLLVTLNVVTTVLVGHILNS